MKSLLFIFLILSPVALSQSDWPKFAAGALHLCALWENGKIKCWGENSFGKLGLGVYGNTGTSSGQMGEHLSFVDLGNQAKPVQISAGGHHTCALFEDGKIKCWGNNSFGQLGLGDTRARGGQPQDMGNNLPFLNLGAIKATQILLAENHSCALFENGKVKCWGHNIFGQLGLGDKANRGESLYHMGNNLPFLDFGASAKVIQMASGYNHTCVLLDTKFGQGKIKCWGFNSLGQLGVGDSITRGDKPNQMGNSLPFVDLGSVSIPIQIVSGAAHACAVFENDKLKCWGLNSEGELGLGDTESRGSKPNQMGDKLPFLELGARPLQVSAGLAHTCILFENKNLKCWGFNFFGQLGLEDKENRGTTPASVVSALPDVSVDLPIEQVVAGGEYTCARLLNRGLKCWGRNTYGTLGLENTETLGDMPGEMGNSLPYVDLGIEFRRKEREPR